MATTDTVSRLSDNLMRAVVRSDAVRLGNDGDITLAVSVMREELKAFLFDARYADERHCVLTGNQQIAVGSLYTTCVSRILQERGQ